MELSVEYLDMCTRRVRRVKCLASHRSRCQFRVTRTSGPVRRSSFLRAGEIVRTPDGTYTYYLHCAGTVASSVPSSVSRPQGI